MLHDLMPDSTRTLPLILDPRFRDYDASTPTSRGLLYTKIIGPLPDTKSSVSVHGRYGATRELNARVPSQSRVHVTSTCVFAAAEQRTANGDSIFD